MASAVIGNTKVIPGVHVERNLGKDGVADRVPVDILIRRLDTSASRVGTRWLVCHTESNVSHGVKRRYSHCADHVVVAPPPTLSHPTQQRCRCAM